ncbi:acid phosphatase 1 isoform 2-T2 [Cochliomyia hominivorax]
MSKQNQVYLTFETATTRTCKFHNYCLKTNIICLLLLSLLVFMTNTVVVKANMSNGNGVGVNKQATAAENLKGKLVFAHVLYRHGDRTPIEPYPNDPWRDTKYWPTGWGQLTNIGKQQQYNLGQWLRKRYGSLLSDTYSKNEIYIRSTDVDRTLMSALSNLAGLYEPVKKDIWNPSIHWQPIPVHTQPEKSDSVLAAKAGCPAYEYALSTLRNSPEFQELNNRYAYLYNYLTQNAGITIDTLEAVQRLNNTFLIEEIYNKTLPEWTRKVYPSADMTYIADFTFSISTYTRQLARLKTGPLIKEMLERFVEKSKGKLNPNRSLWIYSAHDTTVANVLNTLKLYDLHSPPYIACIMLELRLDEKLQPYVSIFYKNTTAEPYLLTIPDCGVQCPLNEMFKIYSDILPKDWDSECKLSTLMMTYEEANVGTAMGILVAIITIMLFLSYVVMIYYRRRSYKNHFSYIQHSKLDA